VSAKLATANKKDERRAAAAAPEAGTISALADLVMNGQIVEACLTDGTFVALMNELKRRGYVLMPRANNDPVKWLKPFLFRVVGDGTYRD
jgi:hypothetical protein